MVPSTLAALAVTMDEVTVDSWFTLVSTWEKSAFSLDSTATAGPMVSMPVAMAASPLASWPLRVASPLRAASTAGWLALSEVTVVDSPLSIWRIWPW